MSENAAEPLVTSTPAPFDFKKHVIRVQGNREYLPVAARILWMRIEHPKWRIITEPHTIDMERQYAIFRATIMDECGEIVATATKHENVRGFPDFIEKSETGSIGRALGMCGYGTQFEPEFDEGDRLADAPRPASGNKSQGMTRHREDGSAPSQRPAKTNGAADMAHCSVDGCTARMTQGAVTFSTNKFGRPLCSIHQKGAVAAPATGAPADTSQPRTAKEAMKAFLATANDLKIGHFAMNPDGTVLPGITAFLSVLVKENITDEYMKSLTDEQRAQVWDDADQRLPEYAKFVAGQAHPNG